MPRVALSLIVLAVLAPAPAQRPTYQAPAVPTPIEEVDLEALARRCAELLRQINAAGVWATKRPDVTVNPPAADVTDTAAWKLLVDRAAGETPRDFQQLGAIIAGLGAQRPGDGLVRYLTLQTLGLELLEETWCDDVAYRPGLTTAVSAHRAMRGGKFLVYHSGAMHNAWSTDAMALGSAAARALRMLREAPEVHEQYRRRVAPDDAVVRIGDVTPRLDGRFKLLYSEVTGHVAFAPDPRHLTVFIDKPPAAACTLTIYAGPARGPRFLRIQIAADGSSLVANHENRPAIAYMKVAPTGTEIQVPWSSARGQVDWMTGIDHVRGYIDVDIEPGEKLSRGFYLLSTSERMQARLAALAEGVIIHGSELLQARGHIPAQLPDRPATAHTLPATPSAAPLRDLLATLEAYRQWVPAAASPPSK